MKKIVPLLLLLAAVGLSGCPATHNLGGSSNGGSLSPLNIVVTQPTTPEAAGQVMASLRKSLTDAAAASHGTFVPMPELRVLRAPGEMSSVHVDPPKGFWVTVFGDNTPATRQKKLDALLTAFDKTLGEGLSGQGVAPQTVRTACESGFKTPGVTVWLADSALNPWNAGQSGQGITLIEDEAAFEQRLTAQSAKGGNFLLVADTLASPNVASTSAPPPAGVARQAVPQEPTASVAPTPGVPVEKQTTTNGGAGLAGSPPASGRDTISIQVNQAPNIAGADKVTLTLPQGAELVGEIFFDPNGDTLDPHAMSVIKRAAAIIKARGTLRVILVDSADSQGTAKGSDHRATKRGTAVEAALLAEGVIVERRIEVGARMSTKEASALQRAQDREVRIYIVTDPATQKLVTALETKP